MGSKLEVLGPSTGYVILFSYVQDQLSCGRVHLFPRKQSNFHPGAEYLMELLQWSCMKPKLLSRTAPHTDYKSHRHMPLWEESFSTGVSNTHKLRSSQMSCSLSAAAHNRGAVSDGECTGGPTEANHTQHCASGAFRIFAPLYIRPYGFFRAHQILVACSIRPTRALSFESHYNYSHAYSYNDLYTTTVENSYGMHPLKMNISPGICFNWWDSILFQMEALQSVWHFGKWPC